MDYSRELDTDATGAMVVEFNAKDIFTVLITVDSDAYWGFNDLQMAVSPLKANGYISIDWQAFPPEVRNSRYGKIVRIYMKRQAAGTLKTYTSFLGR